MSGESSFFAKFFRFTGEAELSDEEDCFLFARFAFFFLFLLPSDEDPLKGENVKRNKTDGSLLCTEVSA